MGAAPGHACSDVGSGFPFWPWGYFWNVEHLGRAQTQSLSTSLEGRCTGVLWPQLWAAAGRLQEGSGLAHLSVSRAGAAPRGAQALPLNHHVLAPPSRGRRASGVSLPTVAISWRGTIRGAGVESGGEQPSMQRKTRTSHESSKPWAPWGSSVGNRLRRAQGHPDHPVRNGAPIT